MTRRQICIKVTTVARISLASHNGRIGDVPGWLVFLSTLATVEISNVSYSLSY